MRRLPLVVLAATFIVGAVSGADAQTVGAAVGVSNQAAGDSVYSAEIIADRVGSYTLQFPGGDNWQATVIPAYTYKPDTFNWRTITGTNLNLSDDSTAAVSSPFPIHEGGATYSTVYVTATAS